MQIKVTVLQLSLNSFTTSFSLPLIDNSINPSNISHNNGIAFLQRISSLAVSNVLKSVITRANDSHLEGVLVSLLLIRIHFVAFLECEEGIIIINSGVRSCYVV